MVQTMEIRKAKEEDLGQIMRIYAAAREYMKRSGNPHQWGDSYPPEELIREDIKNGVCRVICEGDDIHGVFAVIEGEDPTYGYIEGKWQNAEPYVTIHRIASGGTAHGIFKTAADYCNSLCGNVRIDTHKDNKTMQKLLDQNGFIKCGVIYLLNGSPRIAYQRTKRKGETNEK